MKRILIYVLMLLACNIAFAKSYTVNQVYTLNNDLTARINPLNDKNGKPCVVFRISIPDNAKFKGDIYGDVKKNGNEYTVYISADAETLSIYPENGNTLELDLTYLPLYPFQPKSTYAIEIIEADDSREKVNLDYLSNEELIQLAKTGDPNACFELGMAYYLGNRNLKTDQKTGLEWLKKAAEQGLGDAELAVGLVYYNGDSQTPKNPDKAYYWLEKAANKNIGQAQFMMGTRYCKYFNPEAEEDIPKSIYWLKKAVENDFTIAAASLALVLVTQQNYEEGMKYATMAAESGNPQGQFLLASIYGNEEFEQYDLEKFEFWMLLAAEGGMPQAQQTIGLFYEEQNNMDDAVYWYREAAKNGDQEAIDSLKRLGL